MYCNLRPPEPCRSFSALITTPCQVWSRWTYPLQYYSVFAADTLRCDLWPFMVLQWPFTFHTEHLQRIACDVIKLCTKSNPWWSYSDFNDLEHVTCSARQWAIFTKFDHRQQFLMLICYVTLWPWLWPTDLKSLCHFVVHQVSRDQSIQNLSEIKQFPAELLIIFAHVMASLWPWTLTS